MLLPSSLKDIQRIFLGQEQKGWSPMLPAADPQQCSVAVLLPP